MFQNLKTTDAPLGREWIKVSSQFPVHIHDTAETVQYSIVQDSTVQDRLGQDIVQNDNTSRDQDQNLD